MPSQPWSRARSKRASLARSSSARPCRAAAALLAGAALALATSAQTGGGGLEPLTAPYENLDQVGGAFVNLATYPVRPMVYDPSGNLWVVNHHDSTIERFVGLGQSPDKVFGVPWSPVAIAWWNGNATLPAELLVVCRGTWAVIGLDPTTGAPKRLLQLRPGSTLPGGLDSRIGRMAEPGDILVDETNDRAFVSCTGADSVAQIDLAGNQVVRVFDQEADPLLRLKSPLFLSFDHNGVDVLCAPLHSGNNSLAVGGLFGSTLVGDLDGAAQELPDEDLFRIRPWIDAANPGSVEVVMREMGTILFAHGIHPATNDFWQLNTDANNKDPSKQTEPEVKGIFADNRVTIVQNTGSTWGTAPGPILELDPGDMGGAITTANTVGQPFALAFSASGHAFIAGLLTDNVLVLDQDGNYVMEWDLPDGSIPRGLLRHPTSNQVMLVYLWGLNQVRGYVFNTTTHAVNLRVTYNLRHDPTPPDVAGGRRVFFDASHSLEQNLSCASCHIEVGNDFLVWNLSNGPLEEKGPMFTQTMVGLERLAPFHWRGERQLIDFKPAFVGLLGATPDDGDGVPEPGEEPTLAEFGLFEDFIFSLRNPANPNQNRTRRVDPSLHAPKTTVLPHEPPFPHKTTLVGDAIDGQEKFQSPVLVNVGRHSCVDCHDFPTGTNNDINVEGEGSPVARRISEKPAPFHELWRKHQTLVELPNPYEDPTNPDDDWIQPAFLGSGLTHMGGIQDLFRFVSAVTDVVPGTDDDDQQASDINDFVFQWDPGLGLGVHFGYLLNAANAASNLTTVELTDYLHDQMEEGNCDIAVIGTAENALGALVTRRWTWDRAAAAYVCEDPAFANRTLAAFQSGATNDGEANVFLGLPPGMAERFAIDYDMDGVRNLDPTELGTQYDALQPGWDNGLTPGYASGTTPQIVWESTKIARLVFTTNEPTRATVDYVEPKTAAQAADSAQLSRFHSVLLTGLRPSTDARDEADIDPLVETPYLAEDVTYTVTVHLTDATGNAVAMTPFTFQTDEFIVPAEIEQPPPVGPPPEPFERKNMRTHVVQDICMGGGTCDELTLVQGKWRADVDLTIAYKRGSWQIPSGSTRYERVRVKNRMVFGRVLIQRADGSVETASGAGLAVTPVGGSSVLVDDVLVEWIGTGGGTNTASVGGVPDPAGEFLAGIVATDPDGGTSIAFDVDPISANGPGDDLASGDRIVFNVEGVVELDTSTAFPHYVLSVPFDPPTITYKTRWRGSFNQWSFPDTKEARASVRSEEIP